MMTIFVFYKGDDVQFVGTAEECSAHFGIKLGNIRWYTTPTAHQRAAGTLRLYAEKVKLV